MLQHICNGYSNLCKFEAKKKITSSKNTTRRMLSARASACLCCVVLCECDVRAVTTAAGKVKIDDDFRVKKMIKSAIE